jgi:HprK-related kinase A
VTADASSTAAVASLGVDAFADALRATGIGVRLGPFAFRIRSDVPTLPEPLYGLYRDYPLLDDANVFSAHVNLAMRRSWWRPARAGVRFLVDGRTPHEDLPLAHALPVLEWGLNLVIALRAHSLLMLHSGAVEKHGRVLLFPAWPGSGKTTLCAALAHRGWRLLSDEFGLVDPATGLAVPLPRPMPLKNESIAVIREFAPAAEMGPIIPETRKGTIAHVKVPLESIQAADRRAPVAHIVFPRWERGSELSLAKMPKSEAFFMLATNAFNYEVLGEAAFNAVRRLIETTACYALTYSDLESVVRRLDDLVARDGD